MSEKNITDIYIKNIDVLEGDFLEISLDGFVGSLKKDITITAKNGTLFNFDKTLNYSDPEVLEKQFNSYSRWLENYIMVNNLRVEETLRPKTKTWIWQDKSNHKNQSASVHVSGEITK